MNHQEIWTQQTLLDKATLYADRAMEQPRESDLFAFWMSLTLELLARSALASMHPTLLADTSERDGRHLIFALGYTPKVKNFLPRSIATSEVLSRCEDLVPEFTKELHASCKAISSRRNEELHTGRLAFEGHPSTQWLPSFYRCCEALLTFQGSSIVDIFGPEEAQTAETLMKSAADEAADKVHAEIAAHRKVWQRKGDDERARLAKIAEHEASPERGHVVDCPACNCKCLLTGEEVKQFPPTLEDDKIVETQEILPTALDCGACGLTLRRHSQVLAAGLGAVYSNTWRYEPQEYYVPDPEWGDYFNE